jgi:phosphoglucosamine mutase
VLVNVRVADKSVTDHPHVREAIANAERALAGEGRINVRPSGTEPLVRVMVESADATRTRTVADTVANVIRELSATT